MMDDLLISITGFVVLFAIAIGVANEMSRAQCKSTATIMGLEYHYDIMTPCLIKVDGKFIPLDTYRTIQ